MVPADTCAEAEPSEVSEGAEKERPSPLEELFVSLESQLLRYAMRLVENNEHAQDLVQEAFIRLSTRMAEVQQPRAWLYRTIHNLAINQQRSESKVVSFELVEGGAAGSEEIDSSPDERLERSEITALARRFLGRLEEKTREVLILKFDHELSYKEIAAKTGLTSSNVGYILHHGLKDLAHELEKAGVQL